MIYIDQHEPRQIQIEIEKLGITVERKSLQVGDYQFGEFCIERKTVQDFLSSIYSRRMFDQLHHLRQAEKPVLIIVGEIPPKSRWMRIGRKKLSVTLSYEEQVKRYNTIRSNLVIAYTSFNTQVFHAKDEDDFVQFVANLYFKSTKKGEKLRPLRRKSRSLKNIKIDIFSSIPGIGTKLGTYLAENYTVRKLFNMSSKELSKIKNLGKKTSDKIIECVTK